ncbi:MAG: hypothetical protein ACJZ86_02145 [Pontiellaceae bacterium]
MAASLPTDEKCAMFSIVNKHIFLSLLLVLGAQANSFFGIPILGEPKDQLHAVIYQLMKGDYSKARAYLHQLKKSSPLIGSSLTLGDFTIPCADCAIEVEPECEGFEGRLKVVDHVALRYLQYKIDEGLEEEITLKKVWEQAHGAFIERANQVLSREVFQGRVIAIFESEFVVQNAEGEMFFLQGGRVDGYEVGDLLASYCWPLKGVSKSYSKGEGESFSLPVYTMNIWWDY